MSALTIISTSRMPVGFRGAVSQWCLEIAPGVFVGMLSARVADALWTALEDGLQALGDGYAAIVRQADTDQGFDVRHVGAHRYSVRDHGGVALIEVAHRGTEVDPLPDPAW